MQDEAGAGERESAAPDAFISYASGDAAVATALVEALERQGIRCWIAPRDVRAGALYADAIIRAINASRVFVLLLSGHSIASSHVGKEIERASSKHRPIIALRLDAEPLTPALEYFLSESQWVEASGGQIQAAVPKLLEAIRAPVPAPGQAIAATAAVAASPVPGSRPRLTQVLIGVGVALLVGYLAADKLWLSRRPPEPPAASAPATAAAAGVTGPVTVTAGQGAAVSEKSIAVLPFADLSEKKDQEYFSDGLSEDLIDLLTKVPDLHVPARASSFHFKGQNTTVAEIAKALGVTYLLEGTVRKAGNTLRVRAELIRADNGYNVWSETYDRDLKDIFKVQDEIAGRVVAALKLALPGSKLDAAERTRVPEAYNQVLLGRHFLDLFTAAGDRQALEAFNKAISLDSGYAAAFSGLAFAESNLGDKLGDPTAIKRALAAANRAIELAPDSVAGFATRGFLRTEFLWDWAGAAQDFARVVALDPDAAPVSRAALADAQGRVPEAIALLRLGLSRDPLSALSWSTLADDLTVAGDLAEARQAAHRALAIVPDLAPTRGHLAIMDLLEGHPDRALAEARPGSDSMWDQMIVAIAQHSLHHPQESQQALEQIIRVATYAAAYQIASIYAWRGETDQAFAWLDRAYAQHDGGLVSVKTDPLLASLRGDPRYTALLRRMKLPL